jgi:hypothetical protein
LLRAKMGLRRVVMRTSEQKSYSCAPGASAKHGQGQVSELGLAEIAERPRTPSSLR